MSLVCDHQRLPSTEPFGSAPEVLKNRFTKEWYGAGAMNVAELLHLSIHLFRLSFIVRSVFPVRTGRVNVLTVSPALGKPTS
jgi:hypothetical protein